MTGNVESGTVSDSSKDAIVVKEQSPIHELSAKLLTKFRRGGYSEATIWRRYMVAVGVIEKYYERTDRVFYDPSVTEKFMQLPKERFDNETTFSAFWILLAHKSENLFCCYAVLFQRLAKILSSQNCYSLWETFNTNAQLSLEPHQIVRTAQKGP